MCGVNVCDSHTGWLWHWIDVTRRMDWMDVARDLSCSWFAGLTKSLSAIVQPTGLIDDQTDREPAFECKTGEGGGEKEEERRKERERKAIEEKKSKSFSKTEMRDKLQSSDKDKIKEEVPGTPQILPRVGGGAVVAGVIPLSLRRPGRLVWTRDTLPLSCPSALAPTTPARPSTRTRRRASASARRTRASSSSMALCARSERADAEVAATHIFDAEVAAAPSADSSRPSLLTISSHAAQHVRWSHCTQKSSRHRTAASPHRAVTT